MLAPLIAMTPAIKASARPAAGIQAARIQAWQRVHYADLDGDGRSDKIWFTLGSDFRAPRADFPRGHWTLHTTLSSTGITLERTFRVNGYGRDSRQRWTPWVGAADIDHTGGEDLVLGAEAANADILWVVVYTEGSLRILPEPAARATPFYWPIVDSAFHGGGYHCTSSGISAVDFGAANPRATRWRFDRARYVWNDNAWRLTSRSTTYTRTKPDRTPASVRRYTGFDCAGLPRDLRRE